MRRVYAVFAFAVLLFMPVYAANAQSSDRIILLDNFGVFEKGDSLFIFGNLAQVTADSFLILQVINPDGEICQIQQLSSLSNGMFLTEKIPLNGRVCGVAGDYTIKLFYGEHSATAKFTLSNTNFQTPSDAQYFDSATTLTNQKINSITQKTGTSLASYTERLAGVTTDGLSDIEAIYTDLWADFILEDEIYDLDPTFRPAIISALDSTAKLIQNEKLSFDVAQDIDRDTYSAIFYYEIGDRQTAIEKLNDVFVSIQNIDPIKIERQKALTYAELEQAVQNLMTKTGFILGQSVKEELAFIFARGTAPIYSVELNEMLDMLTDARYLDVISRKDNPLYRLIQNDWDSKKPALIDEQSISDLLEHKEDVDKLHKAALLLRDLDNVDRFIGQDSEENSELANIIMPDWDRLASNLELASSVDDILDSEREIKDMKAVIDISSRISKVVEISEEANVDSGLSVDWQILLDRVQDANSIPEILTIVAEFDASINDLREKRNPLSVLKFEYQSMKAKAELQADDANLYKINNALKIIDNAQKIQAGHSSVSRADKIEVLLAWVSTSLPQIREDLDSYTKETYKVRASDILQRAKSIENLVDMSLRSNRFLPGYTNFTDSMELKLDRVRNLVTSNDLQQADVLVRDLFSEWKLVSGAYADAPFDSKVGYSLDELKKIEFREQLDTLNDAVNNFHNADFAPHSDKYSELAADAREAIDYNNFVDAESQIQTVGNFLQKHLALQHERIIFDIEYDLELDNWILSGYLDKTIDWRQNIYVTIYDKDKNIHSQLKFTDTRDGEFLTKWYAPAEPGLYVVALEWENAQASQLVYVPKEVDYTYSQGDLDIVELAREFDELRSFVDEFGQANSDNSRIKSIINELDYALTVKSADQAKRKIIELQGAIERYLPERSRTAVINAQLDDNGLLISGAVQKTLSFSEDLFIDIFDQRGNRVHEIFLKDSSSGRFNELVTTPFAPGTYVVQLQYHNNIVSDFFSVSD